MSGGSGSLDAQYQPVPQQSAQRHSSRLQRPKRIEIDDKGNKRFIFTCGRCGKQFVAKRNRPRTYCGEACRRAAFGELGTEKRGEKRTPQERKNISKGQKKAWQDPSVRAARVQGMHKNPRGQDQKKRASRRKNYTHSCSHCGRIFRNNRKEQKYCSQKCFGKSRRTGETRQCANPNCNKTRYRALSRLEAGRKYCSMECAKSDPAYWESIKKTNEERYGRNYEWGGWEEKRVDPVIWGPLAAKIRAQDDHQCQSCMRKKEPHENNFPVHHILPRSQGGPDEEWNLMTLCPNCHPTTDAQKNPVKYPHEYQSKIPDFEEPEKKSESPSNTDN